jgi:hypothetical protein
MSRKKISTTIYVTPEQDERLRLLHQRTKVPVAVYIREGIDLILRQYGHLLPGQLPLGSEAAPVPPPSAESKGAPRPDRPERPERVGAGEAPADRVTERADRASSASASKG